MFGAGDVGLALDRYASVSSPCLGVLEQVVTSSDELVRMANVRTTKGKLTHDFRWMNLLEGEKGADDARIPKSHEKRISKAENEKCDIFAFMYTRSVFICCVMLTRQ